MGAEVLQGAGEIVPGGGGVAAVFGAVVYLVKVSCVVPIICILHDNGGWVARGAEEYRLMPR